MRSSPSLHPSLLLAMTSNLHFPSVANKKHPSSSIITMIRSLEPSSPPQPLSSSSTSARIVHSTNVQMPKRQMVVSAFSSRHCNEPSNVSSASASSAMSSSSSTSNSTSGSSLSLSSLRAARNSYSSCTSSSSLSPRILDQPFQHGGGNKNGNTHTRYTQRPHPQYSQPLITSHRQQQSNKHNGNDSRGILKNGSGSTIAVPAIIARGEDNEDGGGSPSPPPLPPRSFHLSKSAPQLTGTSNNNSLNCGYNRFDNNMNNKRLPPPLPPKSESYSQNKNQASRMHHSNQNVAPMNRIPSSHESNPLLRYNNANIDQQSSYEMDRQSSNQNILSGSNMVKKSQSVHSSTSTSSSCLVKQLQVRLLT